MGWLKRWLDRIGLERNDPVRPARAPVDGDDMEPDGPPEPVAIEIGPEIDLHVFAPKETRDVVDAYLHEAHARGLREVRIVHGRGKGVQREIVRALLRGHPLVVSFGDSLPSGGGWGATVAVLKKTS